MVKNKDVLKSSIIHGFGTLIAREFFLKIFAFLGQIFLARFLAPADFGVYVIIVFIVNFLGLFADVGLSLAIIQKHEEPTKEELSSVFVIKMSLSILIVVLVWCFAPLVQSFYPSFTASNILMLRVLSVILITGSIRSVSIALLERNIKYNLISIIDIIGVSLYYICTILLAFMHFGIWSFILGALAKEAGETIIVYVLQPFLPQIKSVKFNIKNMIKFGIYIQGNSFVTTMSSSITPVLGGRMSGAYSVGLLDFAYNLVSLPETIAINFGRVAFAGFSRIQKEKEILSNSISKSISMLAIILYIFPVIIFGLGSELVSMIFSAKWIASIPALYWYSAAVFFLPVTYGLGQGILVIGKSKELFWTTLLAVIAGWIMAFILILNFGFIGIAVAYFLISLAYFIFYLSIFAKAGYRFPILRLILPKLLVVFLDLVAVVLLNILLPVGLINLLLKLFITGTIYIFLTFIFVRQDFEEFLKIILSRILPRKLSGSIYKEV
jgi:O-antigen/teichoic acid export membrane protein